MAINFSADQPTMKPNGIAARALAARATAGLSIDAVRVDGGTQSRANLVPDVINEYAAAIEAGAEFPPVIIFYDGSDHWLADGFHRYQAYRQLGRAEIPADVRQGTRRDAVLFSVGANETHGLRRTNEDKRRAVLTLLNDGEWAKWSDREIARRCAVHHELVGRLRPVTGGNASERTYITKHGTPATMNTSAIGKAAPEKMDDEMEATDTADAVTGSNARQRYSLPAGMDMGTVARTGLAREAKGEHPDAIAKSLSIGVRHYRAACDVVFLFDRGGYTETDTMVVERAYRMLVEDQRVLEARETIDPVAEKVWGPVRLSQMRANREPNRIEAFEHAFSIVMQGCASGAALDLPYFTDTQAKTAAKDVRAARRHLQALLERIKRIRQ